MTQVQLQKADPPELVIDSYRDVQRAKTDEQRLRNEAEAYRNDIIPKARGEAERKIQEVKLTNRKLLQKLKVRPKGSYRCMILTKLPRMSQEKEYI